MCNMLQLSLHPQGIGKVMASSQKAIMKAVLGDMSFGQKSMRVVVSLLCVRDCYSAQRRGTALPGH